MTSTYASHIDSLPLEAQGGCVTMGNFDGVHRGHAALVAKAREEARRVGGPAVVLTLDPHPSKILRPHQFLPTLTTLEDRIRLLEIAGADHVLVLRTTGPLLDLRAMEFFDRIVLDQLRPKAVVEGTNFRFGKDREGTVELLESLGRIHNIGTTIVQHVLHEGVPVSSSRVRAALLGGAVEEAETLLTRPYNIQGLVGAGKGRGRTIGVPTANLERIETLIPADGVYAVRVKRAGKQYAGALNIGPNPTFDESGRKVEVHLIDFEGELIGEKLAVEFLRRIRETRRFSGVTELVAQIRKDVDEAKSIVGLPNESKVHS